MPNILICIGTGGELIKIAPVMRELQKRKIPYFFLNTGQHDLTHMIKELKVKKPDKEFRILKKKETRGRFNTTFEALRWGLINLFFNLRKTIKEAKPKIVIVHGDTMTTALTSMAVKTILGIKLAHVEAGIRSHDIFEPYPEEIMRLVTDFFANVYFPPTNYANKKLNKKNSFVTGNTNIDSIMFALSKIKNKNKSKEKYLIAKTHRQENIKSKERFTNFIDIITSIKHKVYFIVTPNTKKQLEKTGLIKKVRKSKNIKLLTEQPYLEFIKYFRDCTAILTDGGGETEEATFLKKPCIVYRYETERQEAEEVKVAVRVKSNKEKAIKYINEAFNTKSSFNKNVKKSKCPYGNGTAAKKIVNILIKIIK